MALPKILKEIFENDGAGPKFRADKIPNTVTVDSVLSATSENPVQNKVVNSALDGKLSLSGGTITGNLYCNAELHSRFLFPPVNSEGKGSICIAAGTSSVYADRVGGYLILEGKNETASIGTGGGFNLAASNASSITVLAGKPGGTLTWGGTFSATTLKATSDKRKKTNITKISGDLSSLGAYRYKFKEPSKADEGFHIGLIAQEVEKVLPEAVSKDDKGFLTLDYNAVVAALVDEVNQLKSEIKQLKAKLS